MAGSAIFSYAPSPDQKVVKLQWIITADASGDVSTPTVTQVGDTTLFKPSSPLFGVIGQVRITPGTAGDQPDDNYNVYLRSSDDSTLDFLAGVGTSCSQTTTVLDVPATTINGAGVALINDVLVLAGSGFGNANKATLTIYLFL